MKTGVDNFNQKAGSCEALAYEFPDLFKFRTFDAVTFPVPSRLSPHEQPTSSNPFPPCFAAVQTNKTVRLNSGLKHQEGNHNLGMNNLVVEFSHHWQCLF